MQDMRHVTHDIAFPGRENQNVGQYPNAGKQTDIAPFANDKEFIDALNQADKKSSDWEK